MVDTLTRQWVLDPARTDAELDEAAAVWVMGWERHSSGIIFDPVSKMPRILPENLIKKRREMRLSDPEGVHMWSPTTDHNHAAELLGRVGDRWVFVEMLRKMHDITLSVFSSPREITMAVLLWKAEGGGE